MFGILGVLLDFAEIVIINFITILLFFANVLTEENLLYPCTKEFIGSMVELITM